MVGDASLGNPTGDHAGCKSRGLHNKFSHDLQGYTAVTVGTGRNCTEWRRQSLALDICNDKGV